MPATDPVEGSGSGWACSALSTTYQRLPSRLTDTVLTLPLTGRCWLTLTWPTPWKRTRVTGSCGVESQRQPSPSSGKSTVSNQLTERKRGNPGASPAFTRRKNAANALSRRRKVACWKENDQRP
jgi:hypothetical protein